jgi:predicted acetyltransferase
MSERASPMVTLHMARVEDRPVLESLFQLYVHDFSEQWSDRPDGEIGEDGRFEPYEHWDGYWRDEERVPLLVRTKGRLIGFALLNQHPVTGLLIDRNMAEFFIARKYRRGGYGLAAAHAVFDRWPGQWEAAVARRNTAALAFWRKAAATHPGSTDIEEIDLDNADWNGSVIRFRIG